MRKMIYYAYYAYEYENGISLNFAVASDNYAILRGLLGYRKGSEFVIVNWKDKKAKRFTVYPDGNTLGLEWEDISSFSKPLIGLSK